MKIIKIGGQDFEIVEEPNPFVDNNNAVDGMIDYGNSKIRVCNCYSLDYKNQTLCHEIIHGIIQNFNVAIPREQNEEITEALGKGLFQVLKENKDILFCNNSKEGDK